MISHKESDTTEWLSTAQHTVDLQCCVNFCCIAEWFSYTCTYIRLNVEELMLSNCGAGEDSCGVEKTLNKEIKPVNPKINPEYSLEGLMLKLQNFGHLMWTFDSLEKTLMLGKVEGKRRGWQRMRQLDSITDSMGMNLGTLWETVWDK